MVYMVRQFRYPFNEMVLEIPAGKMDPGEVPSDTAKRELEEAPSPTRKTGGNLFLYYSPEAGRKSTYFCLPSPAARPPPDPR